MPRAARLLLAVVIAVIAVGTVVLGMGMGMGVGVAAAEGGDASPPAKNELSPAKAVVLGIVEGVTEFLPISSTGHLLVAGDLLDVGTSEATKEAADAYTVVIQGGAILAVLILYWRRVWQVVLGLFGRDADGRRLLIALVVAFLPAVVVGVPLESEIKKRLFAPEPIVVAWIVGGAVVLWLVRSGRMRPGVGGGSVTDITVRQAAIIGGAQVLAMWPGTSRSLTTIVAATVIGIGLSAAVEFSFLLGLVTLGAASVVDLAKHGGTIQSTYGIEGPVIGFLAAAVSAFIAVKWMVGYLEKRSFAVFGWYRIAAGVVTAILLLTGTIATTP